MNLTYTHATPDVVRLDTAVRALSWSSEYLGATRRGDQVELLFLWELSAEEVGVVDAMVPEHHVETLAACKARVADLVDAETRRRIALGYDVTGPTRKVPGGATLHFSLSAAAQMNLAGFDVALVGGAWPLQWDCEDDSDALILPDAAALAAFILAGKGAVALRVSTGRYIRRAVVDALTCEECEAAAAAYLGGA